MGRELGAGMCAAKEVNMDKIGYKAFNPGMICRGNQHGKPERRNQHGKRRRGRIVGKTRKSKRRKRLLSGPCRV